MLSILQSWDLQQVTALAPDSKSIKAAEKLARPLKWETLETDQQLLWGTLYGSGKKPYLVRLNLQSLVDGPFQFKCTCPSRKQPCKHTLALLMVAISNPEQVVTAERPDWVTEWFEGATARAEKKKATATKQSGPKNEASAAKTVAARKEKILAGLDELELWLINLLQGGLSDPAIQTYAFWEGRAARLVDAQAPGIAGVLRGLAGLHVREKNWIEQMMAELGRLYLMIGAFRNFDQLSEMQRADLRSAIGWAIKRDEFEASPIIEDEWATIAVYERALPGQLREQRTWLSGHQSQQLALLLEFAYGDAPFGSNYPVGQVLSGQLQFYPSATTLRAVTVNQLAHGSAPGFQLPGQTISAALSRYAHLVAANPWQTQHLIQLECICAKQGRGWMAVDADRLSLPLSNELLNLWQLFALSGGEPIWLSGLWDGSTLIPLSARFEERWVNLQIAGGYK